MNRIFLDLEANQFEDQHYILQLSAIKVDNNFYVIDEFNKYCKSDKPIKKRILKLIQKEENFFNDKFPSEKDVLSDFLFFSKGCEIFIYGNYDEVVFKSSFKRNGIKDKLKLVDIQQKYVNKYFTKDLNLSLKRLCTILNIEANNHHDAFNDAILLKRVYELVFKEIISKETLVKILDEEKFRPTWKSFLDSSVNKKIDAYSLVWIELEKVKKNENSIFHNISITTLSDDGYNKIPKYKVANYYNFNLDTLIKNIIDKNESVFIFNGDSKIFDLLNKAFKKKEGYYYLRTNLKESKNNLEIINNKIKIYYNKHNNDFSGSILGGTDEVF